MINVSESVYRVANTQGTAQKYKEYKFRQSLEI